MCHVCFTHSQSASMQESWSSGSPRTTQLTGKTFRSMCKSRAFTSMRLIAFHLHFAVPSVRTSTHIPLHCLAFYMARLFGCPRRSQDHLLSTTLFVTIGATHGDCSSWKAHSCPLLACCAPCWIKARADERGRKKKLQC